MEFSERDRENALRKLRQAARHHKAVSAENPFAGSLAAFAIMSMTPVEFQEKVLQGLRVTLSMREVGSLTTVFGYDPPVPTSRTARSGRKDSSRGGQLTSSNDNSQRQAEELKTDALVTMIEKSELQSAESASADLEIERKSHNMIRLTELKDIDCVKFSRQFKKWGLGEKEKLWAIERERREMVEKSARDHEIKVKEKFIKKREEGVVDFNFTEADVDRANRKMIFGAGLYDKTNPLSIGLHAFEGTFITPGQFKDKLKRTFNIDLTARELGSVCKPLLYEDTTNVHCGNFINYFSNLSTSVREELRVKRIESERALELERVEYHKQKNEAALKKQGNLLESQVADEISLLKKLNVISQSFAIDKYVIRSLSPMYA